MDVDGNGTLDLVRTTGTGVSVALNTAGVFATPVAVATGTVVAVGAGRVDTGTTTDLVTIDGLDAADWYAAVGSGPLSASFPTRKAIGIISLTLPAGPYLKITGDPVTITVGDLSLVGDISVTQQTQAGGVRVVTIVVTSLELDLGAGIGVVTLSGSMVVGPGGLAARLTIGTDAELRRRHHPRRDLPPRASTPAPSPCSCPTGSAPCACPVARTSRSSPTR